MLTQQYQSFPAKHSLIAEVTEIRSKVPIVKNLARKKFISQFTLGLIQSQNIQFCQAAGVVTLNYAV